MARGRSWAKWFRKRVNAERVQSRAVTDRSYYDQSMVATSRHREKDIADKWRRHVLDQLNSSTTSGSNGNG